MQLWIMGDDPFSNAPCRTPERRAIWSHRGTRTVPISTQNTERKYYTASVDNAAENSNIAIQIFL